MAYTPEFEEAIRKLNARGIVPVFFGMDCPKCGDPHESFHMDVLAGQAIRTFGHHSIIQRTCVMTESEFNKFLEAGFERGRQKREKRRRQKKARRARRGASK